MAESVTFELKVADPMTFYGVAATALLGAATNEVPIKVYFVRFEAGARTNWHSHSGPQILVVVTGRCRYQIAGEAVRELGLGESVRFEGGVRHWHGAVESEAAEHLAVNLDSRETSWLEPVSDSEYWPVPSDVIPANAGIHSPVD
jgi:quercetin dioxygenase-like cupin family protein